ncbi:MAG: FtsX-like permease family protein, partial [Pseudomonadales bacterium]|nr:FtsX-like permease family protein [Pseudomonadales bacterium]
EQILDQQIVIDGQAHSIVGVLGQNDHLVAAFDVYTPLSLSAVTQPGDTNLQVGTIGKLSPNTSIADVNVAIASLVSSLKSQYPEYYSENYEAWLTPLNEVFRFNVSPGVNAILGFVVITMTALGCISIGNLFTARMLERGQEFALRNALGSSKYRLLRQSLLESFAVCLIGSIVGAGLSYLASFGLAQMGEQIYNSGALGSVPVEFASGALLIDFVFLLFLIVAIWLLSGLIPALKVARKDPSEVLSGSSSGALSSGSAKSTTILVSLQIICTCFALIVCAGGIYGVALTRTMDYGFETEEIITATLDFPVSSYTHNDKLLYMNELQTEVESLSTIDALAFSNHLPGTTSGETDYRTEEMSSLNDQFQQVPVVAISTNYLRTLDIDLIAGRNFDSNDDSSSLPVALIDAGLAESLWPGETVLGKRIQIDPDNTATWVTVVGVTSRVAPAMSANRPRPIVYLPLAQSAINQLHLLTRTSGAPTNISTQLKQAAANVDRGIPLYRTFTMTEHLDSLEANLLLLRNIFATISLAALIMAITGIYGVVSRSILQRVREIGVRRAMGSSNWKVIRLFLKKTATYLGIGSVIGGGPAILALVALIDGDEGVLTVIPPIYIAVCFGLAVFIALATYFPTRRAISMEPGDALRYE